MERVRAQVCLYPTYTHTQTRFEHTRPIPIFVPNLTLIPVVNGGGSGANFSGSGGIPISSSGARNLLLPPSLHWGKIPIPNRDRDRDGEVESEFNPRARIGMGTRFNVRLIPVPTSPLGEITLSRHPHSEKYPRPHPRFPVLNWRKISILILASISNYIKTLYL